MAIKLTGNYAKRLGLPGYSSHQFSVSIETELTDLSQVEDEVARTYRLLQEAVDREIQETGFVPDVEYGLSNNVNLPASNGKENGNGNGHQGRGREVVSRGTLDGFTAVGAEFCAVGYSDIRKKE